mgnify:CR=1 FL=1
MSGLKMFTIGISIFLFFSLGSLAVLVAVSPKPPELSQEEKDALVATKLATNDLMDSFVVSTSIYSDSIGTPNLKMTLKNTSELTIDGIEVMMGFTNNFDEPVTRLNQGSTSLYIAQSQETIVPGETWTGSWNLALYESATKITNVRVYRVHYSDGTTMERYFQPSE